MNNKLVLLGLVVIVAMLLFTVGAVFAYSYRRTSWGTIPYRSWSIPWGKCDPYVIKKPEVSKTRVTIGFPGCRLGFCKRFVVE